jgi:hypothetical protein
MTVVGQLDVAARGVPRDDFGVAVQDTTGVDAHRGYHDLPGLVRLADVARTAIALAPSGLKGEFWFWPTLRDRLGSSPACRGGLLIMLV